MDGDADSSLWSRHVDSQPREAPSLHLGMVLWAGPPPPPHPLVEEFAFLDD